MHGRFKSRGPSVLLTHTCNFLCNHAQTTNDLIEAILMAFVSPTFHFPNSIATKPNILPIDNMAQTQDEMPPIKVPANLPELVRTAFHKARTNGDLIYYPTQVSLLDVNCVPVRSFALPLPPLYTCH